MFENATDFRLIVVHTFRVSSAISAALPVAIKEAFDASSEEFLTNMITGKGKAGSIARASDTDGDGDAKSPGKKGIKRDRKASIKAASSGAVVASEVSTHSLCIMHLNTFDDGVNILLRSFAYN